MLEYRLTRPDCYRGNCPGAHDVSARQGHYVNAEDPCAAALAVYKRLGLTGSETFDVQTWRAPLGVVFDSHEMHTVRIFGTKEPVAYLAR